MDPQRGSTCTPIRSIASTARSAKCWIVCWTPRRSRSGDPRASRAPAATAPRTARGPWVYDATLRSIVTVAPFNGAGSDPRRPREGFSLSCLRTADDRQLQSSMITLRVSQRFSVPFADDRALPLEVERAADGERKVLPATRFSARTDDNPSEIGRRTRT